MKLIKNNKLNYFEHYNILTNLDNQKIESMLTLINNKTVKLINNKNDKYMIIHKCTKDSNLIQCSYFDKFGAYSDITRPDYKEILKSIDYKHYYISEVI